MLRCILFSLLVLVSSRAESPVVSASRKANEVEVTFSGDAGSEHLLQFTPAVGQPWKPLIGVNLNGSAFNWTNPIAGGSGFFRTSQTVEPTFAENFRLTDHQGKSRELYYNAFDPNLFAVVITFAQSNYTSFQAKINKLKTNNLYKTNVLFWTIDTDPANSRTNIARVAATSAISWPIYHDPLQLVTREFDANFNGETFVLFTEDMRIAYRGVIEDSAGRNYVAEALEKLRTTAPVVITRLEPKDSPIARVERPIADYSTVIAPLLQRKCVICHSPGNIGPFAMTSYEGLIEHTPHMKEAILSKMMPPWHADPLYGKFSGNKSLTDTETTQLVDWIEAGIPRGTGPDPLTNVPPEPPKWPAELGEPDQIVTIPTQSVPATGTISYRYIHANTTNTTAKWLRAALVRPSNPSVVHHYIVWKGHSTFAQLTGIATYVPGQNDRPFPDGTGIQIDANAPITFNLHYTADGTAATDKPELALWYSSTPPAKTLKMLPALNYFLNIPPKAPEVEFTASSSTLPAGTKIFSFSPHMHMRGLRMRFELVTPTTRTILCSVPKYDFMWQTIYTLETPLIMPASSRIEVIGAFDNSPMNQFNPDPNVTVGWGEQSWNEMFIGYMEYVDP